MTFSVTQYERAVAEYRSMWRAADEMLYELCRRHPGHAEPGGLYAKILIIGRTYMTGIERIIPSNGTQGSSICQLGQHLLAHAAELDGIFAPLADIVEPLTPDKLRTIIDVHGRLVGLLKPITRRGRSARSFAAKYMHFHCPAVPIFDSNVETLIPKLVRWRKELVVFDLPRDADETYWDYVLRFWHLYQAAEATGVHPTVKHLDYYLLYIGSAGVQGPR